jgi:hypothetical protein
MCHPDPDLRSLALHAVERRPDEPRPPLIRNHPRPHLPRRLVPHVLPVPALKLSDPMSFVVLIKPDDPAGRHEAAAASSARR